MVCKAAGLGLVVALMVGCCGADMARREDTLRRRQNELDQREARLRTAQRRFDKCMAINYPGEATPLGEEPQVSGGAGGAEPAGGAAVGAGSGGAALTPEQLEEIRRTVDVGRPSVNSCYTDELERRDSTDLTGKVVVKIHIGTNGRPIRVAIGKSTLNAPLVNRCIISTVRNWQFPALSAPMWYSTTFELSPAY